MFSPTDLVEEAVARGHRAIALTDRNALYGMVPFVEAARKAGIKPIVGATIFLERAGASGQVLLLVRDEIGYRNLSRLLTRFHLGGRIGLAPSDLLPAAEGLILLTGGKDGFLPRLLAAGREEEGKNIFSLWQEAFRCFVQIGPWWPVSPLLRLAGSLVAVQEACYLRPEDAKSWERLQAGHGLGHSAPGPRHLASDEEMTRLWGEIPQALANTAEIADNCCFEPVFGVPKLPVFRNGENKEDNFLLFRRLCEEGFEKRYPARRSEARLRMELEISVIRDMGFVDYFLIAWDLVSFAKREGIPHMPRGSAAGSLVLYLLGISQICPLDNRLCFERFLNPERKGLPDIDIDFDWRRRDEVVDYCCRTFGEDHVARIATHQHLGPRGAIRLAGAVLGLEESVIDEAARKMPGWAGSATIAETVAKNPFFEREPYKNLSEVAQSFEGIPDHLGLHPCGIVVGREPLAEMVPLEVSAKGPIVTQFEMKAVEAVGLLKMDLLGNRNLAILKDAVELIEKKFDLSLVPEDLPLDDKVSFALLQSGRTFGIYQMESDGVQSLLRQFRPTTLEDVTAVTSLYRPGPIDGGITPSYVARRHGKEKVVTLDPCLDETLAHTYGCILYQEQCLQVAAVFAGMGLGEADNLRRGISKRRPEEISFLRDRFFAGAEKLKRKNVEQVWNLLSHFGGYGFVKAHAASCAALAIREAYVKARWPIEYLSAVLSAGMGYYPPRVYVEDALSFGAHLALPCINRSQSGYTVEKENILRIGLAHIGGIGPAGVRSILLARKERAFSNLEDFRRRTNLSRLELEALITVGACEDFGVSRPVLLWQLERKKALGCGQGSLFPELALAVPSDFPDLPDYSVPLRRSSEVERLGFAVTEERREKVVGTTTIAEVKKSKASFFSVVAEVVGRRSHRTKQGEKMAFLTLSDGLEQLPAILFPEAYRKFSGLLRGRNVFSGKLNEEKLLIVNAVEACP